MANTVLAFVSSSEVAGGVVQLLDAAVKGAAILLAAGLVVLAMRWASAAARHLVWTAGLLGLSLLPIISWLTPKLEVLPKGLHGGSIVELLDAQTAAKQTTVAANKVEHLLAPMGTGAANNTGFVPRSEPAFGISMPAAKEFVPAADLAIDSEVAQGSGVRSWLLWGAGVWILGSALLLLRIGLSRLVLGRVAKAASQVRGGPIGDLLATVRERYALRGTMQAYLSHQRELPMAWGIFRASILLPADAANWPPGRLEAVLLHELAHVKRRDPLTHVLCQLACAVYWVNPLVWLAAWRIHVERERACDDLVVSSGVRPSDYATHLLSIVGQCRQRRVVPCTAVAMARSSSLEGRLVAILNERLNRSGVTRRVCWGVLVTSVLGVTAVATLHAENEDEPSGTPAAADPPPAGNAAQKILSGIEGAEESATQDYKWPLDEVDGRAILPEPAQEAFDTVAELAGLSATEATTLDQLLRGRAFDSLADLHTYDIASFPGDVVALEGALGKLSELEMRQAVVLARTRRLLESTQLNDVERQKLRQLESAILQQGAANVLTIRQVFRPDPATKGQASWTALSKRSDPQIGYMATARVSPGGEFPVRFDGEEQERFRVRLTAVIEFVGAPAEEVWVVVSEVDQEAPGEARRRRFRLVRDEPVEFEVDGDRFSLLYPTSHVRRSDPSTTDQAHLFVRYHPDELGDAAAPDPTGHPGGRPNLDRGSADRPDERADGELPGAAVHDGTIRGTVVSAETGAPVAGAYVGVGDFGDSGGSNYERHREQGLFAAATTDEEGSFELTGLSYTGPDSSVEYHPLVVAHHDVVPVRHKVELARGVAADIEVKMKSAARLEVAIQGAQGNPERGTFLVRIEALDGHRFIPPGRDRHLSAFASSRWTEYVNGGTFTFTELRPGEYAIDAFRLGPGRAGDRSSTRYPPLGETGTAYHAGRPRIALSAGQLEVLGLKPQDHGTRVTIRLPDLASSKLSPDQVRSMRQMMLLTISRNVGLLAWDDDLVHSLEDPRLGRILGSELFTGHAADIEQFTIENLPPGSYSVFAGPAVSLSGARLEIAPRGSTELHIQWKEPQGFASVPVQGLHKIVQLPKLDYRVGELLEILTASTDGEPTLTAAESIQGERVTVPSNEMLVWHVLESLYLSRGWLLAEKGQEAEGELVLGP